MDNSAWLNIEGDGDSVNLCGHMWQMWIIDNFHVTETDGC